TRYGSYTITAQATDNSGAFTLNKRIVRVAPDSAPILDVNTSVLVSDEGRVQFEVTRLDMEGTSANYSWSFNDAGSSTSSSVNPIFNYTTSGTYTPSLTVTDNLGNSKTITKSVVITLGGSYKNIIFDVPSADSDVISFDDNTTQSITVTSFIKDSNSSSPFVNEGVTIVELQSADWLSYSGEDGNNVASGNSATSNNFGIFDLNLSSTTNNTGATRSAKIMFVLNSDSTKNKTFTITQPK
ncbi:MAG: PKD domain-containing protein, partial [Candidatus Scalindua sp.]|nr:PKD domain-containing protein [Candidatus Scalindua sp.]